MIFSAVFQFLGREDEILKLQVWKIHVTILSNHDLATVGLAPKKQHPNREEELSGKKETPLVAPPTEQQSCCQAFRWTVLPFARHSWSP